MAEPAIRFALPSPPHLPGTYMFATDLNYTASKKLCTVT